MQVSEAQIQRQIIDALVYDGWLVIRLNAGGMDVDGLRYVEFCRWQALGHEESASGVSDVLALKNGRVLCIEIKRPDGGRQRDSQVRFMVACEETGNAYVLARSVDDVKPYLTRLEVQ